MLPMQPQRASRFSFVDEGEAVRILGVSRDELLTLTQDGRLRAYAGVGKGNFFRVADLESLAAELHPAPPPAPTPAPSAELVAPAGTPMTIGVARRQQDPAMRVHLRLQADLKWYEISETDLQAWVRELHPAAYEKNRSNIVAVVERLQHLLDLVDEAAARWANKPGGAQAEAPSDTPDTLGGRS